MADTTPPLPARWIYIKAVLFVVVGLLAGAAVVARSGDWTTAALLGVCVWAWCRVYYFAFYVIEKYLDPTYRYAGLWDAGTHLLRKRWRR